MEIISTIRAPRAEPSRISSPDSEKKWGGTYEEYLQSPQWRARRDRALRLGQWRCASCDTKRGLQVHHHTYARLGCELDADLVVLCQVCHESHHVDEQQTVHRIYLSVVSGLLKQERFTTMADLMDAVKHRCAQLRIKYTGQAIWKAIRLADANRHGVLDAPRPRFVVAPDARPDRPMTRAEALDVCRTLGVVVAAQHGMPARDTCQGDRVRAQAEAMRRELAGAAWRGPS
jgi:hypothetical protein